MTSAASNQRRRCNGDADWMLLTSYANYSSGYSYHCNDTDQATRSLTSTPTIDARRSTGNAKAARPRLPRGCLGR